MQKRLIKLNSSALRRSACTRRLVYTLDGYHEKAVGNDIVFGTCFHDFVAAYRVNGHNITQAAQVGWAARDREPNLYTKYRKEHLDDFNFFKAVCTLWAMERSDWDTVVLGSEACAELPWMVPFYTGRHVDVVLCGTIDDVCEHRTNPGVLAIRDYKTTSGSDPDEYFSKYRMSLQLAFYYLGLTKSCELALVEQPNSALAKRWLSANSRHVFIEGIFLNKEPFKCQFKTSEVFEFSVSRVSEIEQMIWDLCERLDVENGGNPQSWSRQGLVNAACEGDYGRKCAFFDACAVTGAEEHDMIMRSQFVKEEYDPLGI